MVLSFTEASALEATGSLIQVVNEPNNELLELYIDNDRVNNSLYKIVNGQYNAVTFNLITNRVPAKNYVKFGVKTFPKIGSYGWFRLKYENLTHVLVPLYNRQERYAPPTFTYTQSSATIQIVIVPPDSVTYICYRIILRKDAQAVEFITYDTTVDIPKPATDTYELYIIGYRSTGEISEETPRQSIEVVNDSPIVYDSFLGLSDTPSTYAGSAGKVPVVMNTENGLDFAGICAQQSATLLAANWSDNAQTVSVSGVTATNAIILAPDPTYHIAYGTSNIRCTAQGAGTLTFTCTTVPASDIVVGVVII